MSTTDIVERLAPLLRKIDSQVLTAATEMDKAQLANPEWLWHDKEAGAATYGRWQKLDTQAPYIRADLVLAALEAQAARQSTPTAPALR